MGASDRPAILAQEQRRTLAPFRADTAQGQGAARNLAESRFLLKSNGAPTDIQLSTAIACMRRFGLNGPAYHRRMRAAGSQSAVQGDMRLPRIWNPSRWCGQVPFCCWFSSSEFRALLETASRKP